MLIIPISFIILFSVLQIHSDPYHARVSVQLTQTGLSFLTGALERQMETNVKQLIFPDVNGNLNQMGMNANVTDIKINQFIPPAISVVFWRDLGAEVILAGGYFNVCAQLSTNIFGTNGRVCAGVEKRNGLNAHISLLSMVTIEEKWLLATSNCRVHVPLSVKLPFPLPVNLLLTPLRMLAENWIQSYTNDQICQLIQENLAWLVGLDQLNITEEYGVKYDLHGLTFTDTSLTLKFDANFIKLETNSSNFSDQTF